MVTELLSRWRVFCPFCHHEFIKSGETKETIRIIIDKPCRSCKRLGVDAVELS
jgi:hypothetical protein